MGRAKAMKWLQRLPTATAPAALGSLVALGAQGLFVLFLLGLFEPGAVGLFLVISQVAFFWCTVALAQSPLSLLADRKSPPRLAARQAWNASLQRLLLLLPLALAAVWWMQRHTGSGEDLPSLGLWVLGMALPQMGWYLAQSLAMRTQGAWSIAAVRAAPPVLALLLASVLALGWARLGASSLLVSALTGYAVGALWLWPLWWADERQAARQATPGPASRLDDPRSTRLKFLHTLSDLSAMTFLAVQWKSLYGATEAGHLMILLRLMGYFPALVQMAWSQAILGRDDTQRGGHAGIAALASVGIAGVAAALLLALSLAWLPGTWQGLTHYLLPIALWQAASCFASAYAHVPFAHGLAHRHSQLSIGFNAVFIACCAWPWAQDAQQHILGLGLLAGAYLLGMAVWLSRAARRP
jgi:hypothetical protein